MNSEIQIFLIFDGQRSAHRIFLAQQVGGIDTLEVFCMIRGNRPSLGIMSQIHLGKLVHHTEFSFLIYMWKNIAETKSVVKHAEHDPHRALVARFLLEVNSQFVVIVADSFVLTPHLVPCLIH